MELDLFRLLPNDAEVETMRRQLLEKGGIEEEEVNQHIFHKIKQDYASRSKDPFFAAFLETQLLNVHIFKY